MTDDYNKDGQVFRETSAGLLYNIGFSEMTVNVRCCPHWWRSDMK